ncbi:MAG: hypothetical protein JWQ36_1922 [Enterovirga sp.]|jgi:hypothetical protein|nr:hypothetical protein [Enterovirga sp.]
MKRMIAVALIATGTLAGAAVAQERQVVNQVRSGQVAVASDNQDTPRVPPRRCSGVGCLQNIPSLGVAF